MYYGYGSAVDGQDESGTYPAAYSAVWHQKEGGASVDSTSNNIDLSVTNVPTTSTGQVNGATHYETNSDDYHGTFCDGAISNLSVSLWVNFDDLWQATMGNDAYLVSKINAGGYWFLRADTAGSLRFVGHDGTGEEVIISNKTSWAADTWFHLVVTYDAGNNEMRFYVNGSLTDGGSNDNVLATLPAATGGSDFYLASYHHTGAYLDGSIDEVKVFINYSLSLSEAELFYLSETDALQTFGAEEAPVSVVTKTFTADAHLVNRFTKTFTTDGYLQVTKTKTFTADAYLKAEGLTKTFTVDSCLQAEGLTKTFTVDVVIVTVGTKTFTADSILKGTILKTFTVDAYLKAEGLTKTFTADTCLQDTFTKTFTVDACLQDTFTKTFTTDAYLQATFTKTFTADAILFGTVLKTFTADACLQDTFTKTFTVDGMLKGIITKTFTVDVVLTNATLTSFQTDFATILADNFFDTQKQTDFATIMEDIPMSEDVTWVRTSQTKDEFGRASASSETFSETISLLIQPITEKDKDIQAKGIAITGHMKAYAKPSYDLSGGGSSTPTVGDTLTRTDGQIYEIETIVGKYAGSNIEVFRKLVLREIDNG